MHFRPFPILTLIAIPALVTLVWLGVWQGQRAGWKAELIEEFGRRAATAPLEVEGAVCGATPVGKVIAPPIGEGPVLRMFGHNAAGVAGWRLFQAVPLSCGEVLAETGFEELKIGGPGGVRPPDNSPPPTRFFVEPWPEKPLMAAENGPDRNEWHWFDASAIGRFIGAGTLNAAVILTPLAGAPDFLVRTPPETHIGYSVTWFGIAAAFAVIYALFHARAGRLRFGKGAKAE